MLRIRVESERLTRRWTLLVDASKDLSEPLKAFAAYLRKRAKERFANEGPGWPGLAASTGERLIHSFGGRFKLSGGLRTKAFRDLKGKLERSIRKGKGSRYALQQLRNAMNGNANNDDLVRGLLGFSAEELQGKSITGLKKQLGKMQSLSTEQRRQKLGKQRQIAKHRLLGRLAGTIRSTLRKNAVTVYSQVDWAGVHNDGGSAGRGAKIPKRTFLELDDEDLKVLALLVEGHLVEAHDDT